MPTLGIESLTSFSFCMIKSILQNGSVCQERLFFTIHYDQNTYPRMVSDVCLIFDIRSTKVAVKEASNGSDLFIVSAYKNTPGGEVINVLLCR